MPLVSKSFSDIITFTRASSGTYFDATGTLQTATTNNARFDYDPSTLAARGMLVEEQRTNLCLHSEDFSNVAWNKLNATVTSNSSTSPSGTTTADTLSASTSDGVITQDIIVSTSTNYTFSVFLKSDTTTNLTLFLFTTSFATISSQAITVTNSWQKFTVSGNSGVNTTIRVSIGGGSTFSSPEVVYAWGAQLEAGAFPTSYIATTAASATRSADVASVNTLSPWYNASNGTFLFIGESFGSGAETPIYTAQDSGATNMFRASWLVSTSGLDRMLVHTSGASVADMQSGTITANQVFKTATAYGTNDFAKSLNGGSVATDTLGVVPTGLNQLIIGGGGFFSNRLNGRVQRITYYPRRLSNAELQGITT